MAWNAPNVITLLRIATIPVFLFVLLSGVVPHGELVALAIFAAASLSDAVDGWIARHRDQVTVFGKFADPLADKLLVMAALLVFLSRGEIWSVWVLIILGREFLVMGLRVLAMDQDVAIPASLWGKLKTVSHIGLVWVLLADGFWQWGAIGQDLKLAAIYLAVALALISGAEYFYKSRQLFRSAA